MGGERRRARGGRIADGVDVVLDRERHAVQRTERTAIPAALVGIAGRGAHALGLEADEGIERGGTRAARQQLLRQRLRGQVARGNGLRQLSQTKLANS